MTGLVVPARYRAPGVSSVRVRQKLDDTPDNVPVAVGWRLIIQVPTLEEKSAGGVMLPDQARDSSRTLAQVGKVIDAGPLAYKRDDMASAPPWCAVGDWVMFPLYGGQKFTMGGVEFRVLNDDEVLARVPDPNAVQVR